MDTVLALLIIWVENNLQWSGAFFHTVWVGLTVVSIVYLLIEWNECMNQCETGRFGKLRVSYQCRHLH